MTGPLGRASIIAALALSSCVYIGIDPLTIKTDSLDEDGDGVPHRDGDRVMVGVSGDKAGARCRDAGGELCDIVAWAFFGPV